MMNKTKINRRSDPRYSLSYKSWVSRITGCLFKNKIALISSIAAHAHSLYPWPSMSHAILCVTNVNIVVIIIVHLFESSPTQASLLV